MILITETETDTDNNIERLTSKIVLESADFIIEFAGRFYNHFGQTFAIIFSG